MASSKGQSSAAYPSSARFSDSECYPAYSASLKFHSDLFESYIPHQRSPNGIGCTQLYAAAAVWIKSSTAIFERWRQNWSTSQPMSFECLEIYYTDKSKCQEHFDVYKECKKKEREARLERNRSRSLFS